MAEERKRRRGKRGLGLQKRESEKTTVLPAAALIPKKNREPQ